VEEEQAGKAFRKWYKDRSSACLKVAKKGGLVLVLNGDFFD
jgi:hypothetical protein